MTRDEIALELESDIPRYEVLPLLRHYAKQGLVTRTLFCDHIMWEITAKGVERYHFLKARVEVEGKNLKMPGKKWSQIEWELLKERKRKERDELERHH